MKSHFTSTAANKRLWVVVLIFAALLLLMSMMSAPGSAQSPSQKSAEARNERLLENKVPTDLPFKIKIKKEKEESFKDLKNENWLREFELELANTGDKPIYFFYLTLVTDVRVDGSRLVFPLTYGRAELGDIVTKAAPDDVPIQPGETHVFKIHPGQIPAWENGVRAQSHPQATKLQAVFQQLSFGDGTGYFINKPYPSADRRQSSRAAQAIS
jgi:hypothetical protein